jgi:hypothetical protein
MAAAEFRAHIGEMLQWIFGSGEFDEFTNDWLAHEEKWNVPGKIDGIYARENRRVLSSYIEAGTSVRTTRFRYSDFFATGRDLVRSRVHGDLAEDRADSVASAHPQRHALPRWCLPARR